MGVIEWAIQSMNPALRSIVIARHAIYTFARKLSKVWNWRAWQVCAQAVKGTGSIVC